MAVTRREEEEEEKVPRQLFGRSFFTEESDLEQKQL